MSDDVLVKARWNLIEAAQMVVFHARESDTSEFARARALTNLVAAYDHYSEAVRTDGAKAWCSPDQYAHKIDPVRPGARIRT